MDPSFKLTDVLNLKENVFHLLESDWMLLTAGIAGKYNMMTAAWGGLGILWRKPVAYIFIRPQRYTYEFAEKYPNLTISFFGEDQRHILNLCGSKSGRDIDKMNIDGLTPIEMDSGAVSFKEARLILDCRKIYFDDLEPSGFVDQSIDKNYPIKDYHRMYVCEILNAYSKK